MFKYFITIILSISLFTPSFAQDYNLELIGSLDYQEDGSDIWGYVDQNGTEYALMGTEFGTAVISLQNPTNPTEIAFIDGGNSTWRDLKTFGEYAYITTEAEDGILILDLSDVSNGNVGSVFFQPTYQGPIVFGQLQTIHNLYIDDNGFCYIAGSNLNNGGVIIYDLNTDPESPVLVGAAEDIYSHDVYVRNDTVWSSNVNDGHFSAIDVSDKANPVTLAYQETTFTFTHNAWLSDSGQFLFTTDELPNANIDAYDVSDINNIQRVDTWVPLDTKGTGVIPHNVHVYDDYLVISYYTDGVKIVDAHRPSNLVEVGSYDSYQGGSGFFGCWGAYPFLPSGLILGSDIGSGLLVLDPTYQRACYLEGTVTDVDNGLPLNNVSIVLNSGLEDTTPSNGEYATGQVTAGTFQATYSKVGYMSQTVDVVLENGVVTIQDIALVPDIPLNLSGQVIDEDSGMPINNAAVRIETDDISLETTTNANGDFQFSNIFQNTYQVFAGKWGHHTVTTEVILTLPNGTSDVNIELEQGYEDPFAVDLGWTVSGNATAGDWELGAPIGTQLDGVIYNPYADVAGDIGDWCYVTGNSTGSVTQDDVDGGTTTLLSPLMDLTNYSDPYLSYQIWFMNGAGSNAPDDNVVVSISNGTDEVVVATLEDNTFDWTSIFEFKISDFISITNTMRIKVETADMVGSGNLLEVAFDNFKIYDGSSFQTLTGIVQNANGGLIINAAVRLEGSSTNYWTTTNADGSFEFNDVPPGQYEVYAGKWSYTTEVEFIEVVSTAPEPVNLVLTRRYEDPFALDLGWTVTGNASAGIWDIGEPVGTIFNGANFNPDMDVDGDVGGWCYTTGNSGGSAGADDVDDGNTILTSPSFNLESYQNPFISYQAWFMNGSGESTPNDQLTITISNGTNEVVIENISNNTNGWRDETSFRILDFVSLSNNMSLKVETSDNANSGHLVEGGLDNFKIYEDPLVPIKEFENEFSLDISPNPFHTSLFISIPEEINEGTLSIFDALGRMVFEEINEDNQMEINTEKLPSGIYYIVYISNEIQISHKVVKQ
jgi:choice-of-anchor B domain-containing protein